MNVEPSQLGWAAPWSPEDASSVMPLSVALANIACCARSIAGSTHCSASPNDCEITSPRLWSTANWVADRMSASSLDLASTSLIVAAGAIACAHSTSSVISPAQPTWLASFWSNGVRPSGATMFTVAAGSSKTWSNRSRSCWMVGLWKASTMTIVLPAPSALTWSTPYAARICAGPKQPAGVVSWQLKVGGTPGWAVPAIR